MVDIFNLSNNLIARFSMPIRKSSANQWMNSVCVSFFFFSWNKKKLKTTSTLSKYDCLISWWTIKPCRQRTQLKNDVIPLLVHLMSPMMIPEVKKTITAISNSLFSLEFQLEQAASLTNKRRGSVAADFAPPRLIVSERQQMAVLKQLTAGEESNSKSIWTTIDIFCWWVSFFFSSWFTFTIIIINSSATSIENQSTQWTRRNHRSYCRTKRRH